MKLVSALLKPKEFHVIFVMT